MNVRTSRRALVAGSSEWVKPVSEALEEFGFDVVRIAEADRLAETCTHLGQDSLDCYVQLPGEVRAGEGPLVEAVRDFLTAGLLARFDTAASVVPALRREATVVFVAGDQPAHDHVPDDPHARFDLLHVLARSVQTDAAKLDVRAFVVGPRRTPEEIAEVAARHGALSRPTAAEVAAASVKVSYEDWKREMLSLSSPPRDWELAVDPIESHNPLHGLGHVPPAAPRWGHSASTGPPRPNRTLFGGSRGRG